MSHGRSLQIENTYNSNNDAYASNHCCSELELYECLPQGGEGGRVSGARMCH